MIYKAVGLDEETWTRLVSKVVGASHELLAMSFLGFSGVCDVVGSYRYDVVFAGAIVLGVAGINGSSMKERRRRNRPWSLVFQRSSVALGIR